jgi:hypothetical protein
MQALARGLLLVLLAVDWAADPALVAPAVAAQARRWSNTETVCPGVAYRHASRRDCAPALRPAPGRSAPDGSPRLRLTSRPDAARCADSASSLVYLFMSIRR